MFGIGFTEIIVILIIALIIIGPSKLPDFARSVGKGLRQFQDSFNSVKQDLNKEFSDVKDFTHTDTIIGEVEKKDETPQKDPAADKKDNNKEC